MGKSNKSYQPLQMLSIKSTEDLPANRFVGYDGGLCEGDARAFGATEVSWMNNELISAITLGTAIIETATGISAGMDITSDAHGKAIQAGGGAAVNGRALDTIATAGFIRVKLVP